MITKRIHIILTMCLCLLASEAQAQHVTYRSFAHYNKRVAQFEREGGINSQSIVMLGNSLTENGKDWSQRLDCKDVVNRGIIGDNTVGMTERLCQVIGLIEAIREQAPDTKLFVESLLPINEKNGRWRTLANRTNDIPLTNMYIRAYCESHGIVFIDLFSKMTKPGSNVLRDELSADGLHITEQGYAIWETELKKYLSTL